jgi:hypothetical protein
LRDIASFPGAAGHPPICFMNSGGPQIASFFMALYSGEHYSVKRWKAMMVVQGTGFEPSNAYMTGPRILRLWPIVATLFQTDFQIVHNNQCNKHIKVDRVRRRLFGHQSAIRPMRRWPGNGCGVLSPHRLGLAEAACERSEPRRRGASPARTSEHPKSRSSPASAGRRTAK